MNTFETFWNLYPKVRRVNKKGAEAKWEKLTPEVHTQIIAHIEKRVKEDEQWIKGYAPMPVTFLNQERWKDEYVSVKQPKKEEKVYNTRYMDAERDYQYEREMFLRLSPQEKVTARKGFLNFMFVTLTGDDMPEEKLSEIKTITYNFFREKTNRMYPDPKLYKHLMKGTPLAPQALITLIATDMKYAR